MGSVREMYEEFSNEQILEQLDDFGDGQFFMHEVAKRLRAMAERIVALEANADTVRDGALRQAESIADNVARLETRLSRRDGYMAASDIEHRIAMVRAEGRATQPQSDSIRDATLAEVDKEIWTAIERLPGDGPEYAEGLQLASSIVNALRATALQPKPEAEEVTLLDADAVDEAEQRRREHGAEIGHMGAG